MISGIVVYISWFMGSVRPAIARRMARWFGVQGIEESDLEANYAWFSRPGWWVAPGSGFVLSAKVAIADFVVLIFGVVLPVTAIATGVVLASSRFLA